MVLIRPIFRSFEKGNVIYVCMYALVVMKKKNKRCVIYLIMTCDGTSFPYNAKMVFWIKFLKIKQTNVWPPGRACLNRTKRFMLYKKR